MSISHRGKKFSDIYRRTDTALRHLMQIPTDYSLTFLGSATEAMERILQNLCVRRSHHFVNGNFSDRWYQMARQLGLQPTETKVSAGNGFDQSTAVWPVDCELVCMTQNETSTGASFALENMDLIDYGTDSPLIALDIVSSAPLVELRWPKLDAVFFSIQKCFGLPAGLGVLITSPRAHARSIDLARRGARVGSYHSLPQLNEHAAKYQTPATPNVLGIYLLGRVAEDMIAGGVDKMRANNRLRSDCIYGLLESSDVLAPFVKQPRVRSTTVIVSNVVGGNEALSRRLLNDDIVAGMGYGTHRDLQVRIANFPAMSELVFDKVVGHLQAYRG